ncbi:MAG TPA: hypothetical protein VHM25_24390 [Polyangiaceae bacterium]|nr:hypothetical protein [Polyangiaceae bacterium]
MKRLALCATLFVAGCSGSLPTPPRGEHPLSAFVEVPYPPPAALAETVPEKPRGDAVWVDGEWNFHGEGYVWRRGGWVATPQGSHFAPWQAWYRSDGRLMMARGSWYDDKQQRLRPPKPIASADTPPNQITSEFQTGR